MGLEALADKGGFSPIRSLLGTLLRVLTCCSSEAIVGGMLSKLLALFEKSFAAPGLLSQPCIPLRSLVATL